MAIPNQGSIQKLYSKGQYDPWLANILIPCLQSVSNVVHQRITSFLYLSSIPSYDHDSDSTMESKEEIQMLQGYLFSLIFLVLICSMR